MQKQFFLWGGFFGFSGVALGAFGAHGLKKILSPEMLAVFETAVRYQMYHAFALCVIAFLADRSGQRFAKFSGFAFITGIILFSGSLYAMALSEVRMLGFITPFGGISFLLGWLFFFLSALKIKKEN